VDAEGERTRGLVSERLTKEGEVDGALYPEIACGSDHSGLPTCSAAFDKTVNLLND